MNPIRVMVAEPQPIFMRGLEQELDGLDDIELVARATTGTEAAAALRRVVPDVAVLAIRFPDLNGIQVLEGAQSLPTQVIFLTAEESRESILRCIRLGARGYLLKWCNEIQIADAIRRVINGEIVMTNSSLVAFIDAVRRELPINEGSLLSDREVQILSLMRQGMRQSEIAAQLNVAISTVATHRRHAYNKLGAKGGTEAVAEALRLKLIE